MKWTLKTELLGSVKMMMMMMIPKTGTYKTGVSNSITIRAKIENGVAGQTGLTFIEPSKPENI